MTKNEENIFRATGLFVSGFQSIANPTYIPLKPLTFLYGPNSAGKSAVIDAIGLIVDIAAQREKEVMNKVNRWQHRELKDDGSWPAAGLAAAKSKNGIHLDFPRLHVGAEYVIPNDWKSFLSQEVLDFKKNDWEEQRHLERLDALIGHKIQVDIGISDGHDPFRFRLAIDNEPVFESRLDDKDHGSFVCFNETLQRDDDSNEIAVHGPLRIYSNHSFWKNNRLVQNMNEFARQKSEPLVSGFVSAGDGFFALYDVFDIPEMVGDRWDPFLFNVGGEFWSVLNKNERIRKRNLRETRRKVVKKGSTSSRIPTGKRTWGYDEVSEFLEELSVFLKALIQLGAASLKCVHVSGSRQILTPADMTFSENYLGFKPSSPYVSFARNLASEEGKGKLLGDSYPIRSLYLRNDYKLVNKWMINTLPSLRGSKLRVDAYRYIHIAKNRSPFSKGDLLTYRLYVVDGQGRPHEFEDVGSGFSYVFPILIALWDSNWSIVEQPELHLHPSAQCDLADVFIAAKNIGHDSLIESHSENLLLRILRRIRETNEGRQKDKSLRLEPEDVAIIYFDPQEDGTTKVQRLRISRDGDFIDRWPAGFFEERTKELFGE